MKKILISACLLGAPVRYDALGSPLDHELIRLWQAKGRLVPVCPEMLGGLPAPRPCCEILGSGGGEAVLDGAARVMGADGGDLTEPFVRGARQVLAIAREQAARIAILKERSPSCGSHIIYDGHFASRRIAGRGVTTALLEREGIRVFCEDELAAVADLLED
ncbi:MAG: hypothetical protein BWY87_00149 [Deltaproteobacteria bacterium ADurb.Bin510]|nr:MAG: hypothetical protein BWY87_00149 [Deltaproteobacteria bacterium ADurb.Bin510]